MPKTDHLRYRQVLIDAMDKLRDCSVQAERLYLRMAAGSHATRLGIVLRPLDMTAECRMRKGEIQAALLELQDAGLVALSVSGSAYIVGHCTSCCRRDAAVVLSWRDDAVRVLSGNRIDLLPQVLEEIESILAIARPTVPKGVAKEMEREREREKEREIDTTPRSATQPSAATAPDDTAKGRRKKSDDTEAAAATALIAAYNETRGSMPQCEGKPDSAAHKAARTRWRAEPDLDLWRKRFVRAEASDFLSGRKTGWRADLLWLLNKTNAEKLDMGRYDNVDASSSNDGREYVTIGGRQVAVNLPRAPLTEEQLALDKYYENLPPEF